MRKSIDNEKSKIRNCELFVAAATKNLKSVKSLVQSGADVNYIGSEGNTPLHCAVKNGCINNIKYLLSKGADVYIENDDFKTSFDLVYNEETKKDKRIKIELQKTLIEKSFVFLKNYVKDLEPSQLENVNEDLEVNRELICVNGFKWNQYSFDEESSIWDLEFFREVNKKGNKLKSCYRCLKCLNEEGKSFIFKTDSNRFNYELANIFIFFLEAVAFQDVDLSVESKIQIRKEFEMKGIKINEEMEKEIQKEINKRRTQLAKDVKEYFTSMFYPINFEEDIKLIDVARTLLCHSSNKKITLDDVGKLISSGTTMRALFSKLYEYVSYICDKMAKSNGSDSHKPSAMSLVSLLLKIEKKNNLDIGTQGEDILEEELVKVIMATYNQEEWTREITHKLMFSLLVNVSPAFGKEVSGLCTLRNKIIHEFHKYKDVDSIIKMEFKRTMYDLRSKLFKYHYAKIVHKILHEVKPSDDFEDIKNNLSSALKEFEEKFGQKFKTASQEDADGSFEYRFSLASESTGSSNKDDLSVNITQYLKFMAIVDEDRNDHFKENSMHINDMILEDQCDENLQNSDEEEFESENISTFIQLNIFRRREIFENFLKLKQLNISVARSQYLQEKKLFKDELTLNYGVNEHYFNAVCRMYIEKNTDLQKENLTPTKKIIDIINVIRGFQSGYALSMRDILLLYTRVVEGNGIYDLESNLEMLKNKKIPISIMEKFHRDISALHRSDVIYVSMLGKQKIELNIVKTVTSSIQS